MQIVKLFAEEPFLLETRADAAERSGSALEDLVRPSPYTRAYLAGTDLAAGRTGLTALTDPTVWREPLVEALRPVFALDTIAGRLDVEEIGALLGAPRARGAMAWGRAVPADPEAALGDLRAVAEAERRHAAPALRRLLDTGLAVLVPEPAHDGFDWSLFAAVPLRAPIVAAWRRHPLPGVRRFVADYRRVRSEHRFYFERWALETLPDGVEEVG